MCATVDGACETYNLSVEVELPFSVAETQDEEVLHALRRCVVAADRVEERLLRTDRGLEEFERDLVREAEG